MFTCQTWWVRQKPYIVYLQRRRISKQGMYSRNEPIGVFSKEKYRVPNRKRSPCHTLAAIRTSKVIMEVSSGTEHIVMVSKHAPTKVHRNSVLGWGTIRDNDIPHRGLAIAIWGLLNCISISKSKPNQVDGTWEFHFIKRFFEKSKTETRIKRELEREKCLIRTTKQF